MAAKPFPKKKATIRQLVDPPTTQSTVEKLKAADTTQIRGPDADMMRDLKGKHMIGGNRRSGSGRKMIGKR